MKKLLLLLISLLLSYSSYGEEDTVGDWFKAFTDDDISWYINLQKIQERDGLVYFWYMASAKEGSQTALTENDCMLSRSRYLESIEYDEPLMEGEAIYLPNEDEWVYFPPDSIGDILQMIACELATYSLEDREERMTEFRVFVEDEIQAEVQKASDNNNEAEADWVRSIAEKVKSNWRYQGANDDWTAEVYILQDRNGNVLAVDVRNTNVGDSSRAKTFTASVERAVKKSTPLPYTSNDDIFNKEILFIFGVN